MIRSRRRFPLVAWILIGVVGAAAIFGFLFFLPLVPVSANDYREIPSISGIDALNLTLSADIAQINVTFVNLPSQLVTMNVTMSGNAGLYYTPGTLHVTFDNSTSGDTLVISSDVTTGIGFLKPFSLSLMCDLRIDTSLNSSLSLRTSVGTIDFSARNARAVNSLDFVATTGTINAQMPTNTRLNGNVSLTTTTGSVDLSWQNVITASSIFVTAGTTTGGVAINVNQNDRLQGDVVMMGKTTTGSVDLNMTITNNVGANVQSSVTTGSVNVDGQVNFNGNKTLLQSTNYPAADNFNVTCRSTTGNINLNMRYNP